MSDSLKAMGCLADVLKKSSVDEKRQVQKILRLAKSEGKKAFKTIIKSAKLIEAGDIYVPYTTDSRLLVTHVYERSPEILGVIDIPLTTKLRLYQTARKPFMNPFPVFDSPLKVNATVKTLEPKSS